MSFLNLLRNQWTKTVSCASEDYNHQKHLEEVEIGTVYLESGSLLLTDDPRLREQESFIYDGVPKGQCCIKVLRDIDFKKWAPYGLTIANGDFTGNERELTMAHDIGLSPEPGPLGVLVERSYAILVDAVMPPLKIDDKALLKELFGESGRCIFLRDKKGINRGVAFVPAYGAGWYPVTVRREGEKFELKIELDPPDDE